MLRTLLALPLVVSACAAYTPASEPAAPPASPAPAPSSASSAPSPSASAAPSAEMEMLPPAYTAEQIRDATHPGRLYDYRVEKPGAPTAHVVMRMTKVSADGAEVESSITDDSGKLLDGPRTEHGSWVEFRKHAEFPKALTSTHDESIEVPAGKYACTVYVVKKGDAVATFYFAKTQPGPPVLFFTDKGGARVMTSTLVRYLDGEPAKVGKN